MGILVGITNATIDGDVVDVSGAVKFTLSTVEREATTSMSGVVHYKEKPIAGSIGFDVFITGDIDPSQYASMTSVNVAVDAATGMQLIGDNMFQSGKIEYDAAEGTVALMFESQNVTVVTA